VKDSSKTSFWNAEAFKVRYMVGFWKRKYADFVDMKV
jgi:hypothetical protein